MKCGKCKQQHASVFEVRVCYGVERNTYAHVDDVSPVHEVRTWHDNHGTKWCAIDFPNRLLAMDYARTHMGRYRYSNNKVRGVTLMWRSV